ncbi:MAG: hypothetical protein ACN6O2_09800 [Stenotrophomonas sp.]
MIPGPLFSWQMLLLMFVLPAVGGMVALGLLLHALQYRLRRRGSWAAFFSWKVRIACVFVAVTGIWVGFLGYKTLQFEREFHIQRWQRLSREQFVLPRDFQYGELLVPKGTLVNRRDAFDNGEAQRPLGLRGLDALVFPQPLQVAGVWAEALEASPGRLRLSRDQRISPLYHYDGEQGDWVVDPSRPYLDCHAGETVWFDAPLFDYDIQAEFLTGEPDGAQARFKPSQWRFTHCENDWGPIEVKPAFAEPMPKGAQREVFAPQAASR